MAVISFGKVVKRRIPRDLDGFAFRRDESAPRDGLYLFRKGWKAETYAMLLFQRDRFNQPTFTLECMISLLPSWMVCDPLPLPPGHQALGVRERIGPLSIGKDLWWSYRSLSELGDSLSEAMGLIVENGFAFFDEYSKILAEQRHLLHLNEDQKTWLRQWADLYERSSARTHQRTLANVCQELQKHPHFSRIQASDSTLRFARSGSDVPSLFAAGRYFLSARMLEESRAESQRDVGELMPEARRLYLLWSYNQLHKANEVQGVSSSPR
jgi:hypothetical protein